MESMLCSINGIQEKVLFYYCMFAFIQPKNYIVIIFYNMAKSCLVFLRFKNTSFLKKTKGSDTLSYSTNNISNTAVTIRKTRKFTVPVIVSHQETDRAIHLTLQ